MSIQDEVHLVKVSQSRVVRDCRGFLDERTKDIYNSYKLIYYL